MQLKPITAIIVLFLVVVSLSTAGCMSNTSSPSSTPTSQVKQYADAWHKSIQDGLGPNETLTVWKEKENGSDTVRLQWTVANSTTTGFDSNGTTTSYSVNVKQFANTDDATAFYDDTSFGYVPSTTVNATLIKPEDNIYQQVTGKNITVLNGAWKLDSFTFVTMQASFVVQQNEFVVWGTASVMPNGSTSTTTPTSTQVVPSAVLTPTPTPTPTPPPTPTPTPVPTPPPFVPVPYKDIPAPTYGSPTPNNPTPNDTNTMTGATGNGPVMVSDANGSETTWAPNGVHTLNAEYLGDTSLPNASIPVTKVSP